MEFFWELIGPELARAYLVRMWHRNNMDWKYVFAVADAMKSGEWRQDSRHPIVIDENGRLVNGRHRLMAIFDSGTTQRMLIQRGDTALAATTAEVSPTGIWMY